MYSYKLPSISDIPGLSITERALVLDAIFEPCVDLHTLSVDLIRTQQFDSYNDLIQRVGDQLRALSNSPSAHERDWLDRILRAHPRLGEKKIDSAQSRAEQSQLHVDDDEKARELRDLNAEYEKTFPGLKYVVFVNGRSHPIIIENMRSRIDRGDVVLERAEAIKAMCDIAVDRATKHQQQQ